MKTNSPIDPTKTGTMLAQKDSRQRLNSANLNDSPIPFIRFDSLAISRSTSTIMKANETNSDELLKKKSVYRLSSVPSRKCTKAMRYS